MRVGLVAPFPPIRGGIAQHSSQIGRTLVENGHQVDFFSWRSQYPKMLYRRPEKDLSTVPFPEVRWDLQWWNPLSWLSVGRKLRKTDLFVFPWTVPFHAPHYLVIMAIAKKPVAIMVHNALPHEPFPAARFLARQVLKRAIRLVAHAEEVADVCKELAPNAKVIVVGHPPDLPVIEKKPPSFPPLKLVALGYLRDYKGVDLAIETVAQMKAQGFDIRLTVAGEPWDGDQKYWQELVKKLEVSDVVTLKLSYQTDHAVAELLADHHALVAPYRSATQSGIVAQALGAGRPVIATSVGGLPDVISEGVNGVLAEPESVSSLQEAIVRFIGVLPDLMVGAGPSKPQWSEVSEALVEGHKT